MKEEYFAKNPDLKRYCEELKVDSALSVMNLKEKSLMVSTIRSKWLQYLFQERENLTRIKETKQLILESKLKSSPNASVLRLKNEDTISQNDEKIQKLNKMQKCVETNIDFIEQARSQLAELNWQVKNSIELLKLELT